MDIEILEKYWSFKKEIDKIERERKSFAKKYNLTNVDFLKGEIYSIDDNSDYYLFCNEAKYFEVLSPYRFDLKDKYLCLIDVCLLDEDLNPILQGKFGHAYRSLHVIHAGDYICMREIEKSDPVYESAKLYVYVMIDENTGYYKIGKSMYPSEREKTLQSEKPTIKMLYTYQTERFAEVDREKELHEIFKNKRIRGEWFDLNESDLKYIDDYFNN